MSAGNPTPHSKAVAKVLNAYGYRELDSELNQLIRKHGKEAVKARAKELTKSKPGRRPDPDWKLLWPVIETDAKLWLEGGTAALSGRSNYKIAKAFSDEHPGHSAVSTYRKIMRKLAKSRRFLMLATAEQLSRDSYPYEAHLRTLQALALRDSHKVWSDVFARAQGEIERYRERDGDPDPQLSFAAIEEANRPKLNAFLPAASSLGGLLGMFGSGGNALKTLRGG